MSKMSKKVINKSIEISPNDIVKDHNKNTWIIGDFLGEGGFGKIHFCHSEKNPKEKFIIKLASKEDGSLFVENHFYIRMGKKDIIDTYKKVKKLSFLGIPPFVEYGTYNDLRYLILPRFQCTAEMKFNDLAISDLDKHTNLILKKMLHVIEYLQKFNYSHGDIKPENIMYGSNNSEIYLIDFGMITKIKNPIKPDPKLAEDGTPRFSSIDSYSGTISYRADLHSLFFTLKFLNDKTLPWVNIKLKKNILASKNQFLKTISEKSTSESITSASVLDRFGYYITKMNFDTPPDFNFLLTLTED